MTDSMKFGPEWLRNMSAEPPNSTIGVGGGTFVSSSSMQNSTAGSSGHTPAPRNMFPEFRYGREEMLSLFDRSCILPQILTSYKKLFVEKVQYPLALTPSTEDEVNAQGPTVNSSRPPWLQRSPVGFGTAPRGTGRGGTAERGRMRGKSVYHSIYQRPPALYEDGVSPLSLKPERTWTERNGTNELTSMGGTSGTLDWNGTPTSSPRKEFSNHPRNMENWRRSRNEDGSGDGPVSGGIGTTDGWRSGNSSGAGGGGFGSSHRWGRSTSWRDEDSAATVNSNENSTYSGINMQRSLSTIGTVGADRQSGGYLSNNIGKNTAGGGSLASGRTLVGAPHVGKGSQQWSAGNSSGVSGATEVDDNLPEWAMENPSDVGGTFDASGAFHGEGTDDEMQKKKINEGNRESPHSSETKTVDGEKEGDPVKISQGSDENDVKPNKSSVNINKHNVPDPRENPPLNNKTEVDMPCESPGRPTEPICLQDQAKSKNKGSKNVNEGQQPDLESAAPTPAQELKLTAPGGAVELKPESLGDISERMKEVADEVEKLIMDDDGGVVQNTNINVPASTTSAAEISGSYVTPVMASVMMKQTSQVEPCRPQHAEALPANVLAGLPHKTLPFAESLAMQQHLAQQQQMSTGTLPTHVLNPNSDEFWYYRDPQSNIQGPFSAIEMTEWYRAGYFNENLFVRRVCDSRFRPLGELIKVCHGNMPFTHSHLIPSSLELDSLQMASNKSAAISLNDSQQQRNEEQLKGNVTAAADSLSAAVKNHISSMGMSHMLTMQFQMLQEQYMQHQEHNLLAELSKNDCFQRLSQPEKEAVLRQKVQMLVLPEYLSSFSGLSNSLAALNPIAGNQLYDVIAEQAKKDQQQHIFPGNNVPHQPRLEADDFIMNAQLVHQQSQQASQQQQQQQHTSPYGGANVSHFGSTDGGKVRAAEDLSGNNLLNFRMFLGGGNTAQQPQPKPNAIDFMADPQIMTATPGGQNIMMPMWLPQFAPNGQQSLNPNQPPPIIAAEQSLQPQQHGQWGTGGNVLVGMPNADLAPKPMSVTLWDVAALEEAQNQQILQKRQQNMLDHTINMPFNDMSDSSQQKMQQLHQIERPSDNAVKQQAPAQPPTVAHQQQTKQKKDELQVATQLPTQQQINSKAIGSSSGKHQSQQATKSKLQEKQVSEEERRREQAEEKRRQKEERKRQLLEEEKRRAQQIEEEKHRQMQEEKERQLQIQAQRRKALLGSASATIMQTVKPTTKGEQQRSHSSSIAPWSLQTGVSQSVGPGLAEIQKAERRERRADMQRQQEQQDKQLRANAVAAAEANEAMLKWQASPAPTQVMSLDEIQAEEAKRLAEEQLELQRRREQEQQQQGALVASAGLVGNNAGGLSNIWGSNTKAWSGTVSSTNSAPVANTFWDEPIKFNSNAANNGSNAATAAAVLASGLQLSSNRQQQSKASVSPSARNLRKSQTVPAIQSSAAASASSSLKIGKSGNGSGQQQDKNKLATAQNKSQKANDEKKINAKQNNVSGTNKAAEYENEFTSWCMKSLSTMSAKVDVPTFVTFLQDLEAPYEVKDYVRMYLGEGKESTDFAKQFLERRSKYKNLQRAQNAHNDDMCKPAPAITPSGNDNSDTKNKQKKIKKNKMTKLDARILGFSVTAAEGRINVGDRDYVDAP